jgi:small GTP-binding protein
MANNNTVINPIIKIVVLGDSGVGKSTFIKAFENDHSIETTMVSTIGSDIIYKTFMIKGHGEIQLHIWDTAGQEKFSFGTDSLYRSALGCIMIYDIGNRESFINLTKWINKFYSFRGKDNRGIDYDIIIVANKNDLKGEKREVSMAEATDFSNTSSLTHVFCSSLKKSEDKTDIPFKVLLEKIIKLKEFDLRVKAASKLTRNKVNVSEQNAEDCTC